MVRGQNRPKAALSGATKMAPRISGMYTIYRNSIGSTYMDQFEIVTIVDTRNPCFTLAYCRIFGYVRAQKAHF